MRWRVSFCAAQKHGGRRRRPHHVISPSESPMRPRPQQVESLRSEAPAVGRNNRQKVRPRNGALFASAPGCRFGERAGSLVGARPPSLFSVLHHYMFRNWQPISADGGSPDTRERDHSNLKERQSLLLLLIIISSNDDDNLYSAISACSLYREQNIQHVFSLSPPPPPPIQPTKTTN